MENKLQNLIISSKKVSIITISYNSEKTIEKTIQSVMNQPYRPLEYIFVDGGSTDKTIALIKKNIPLLKARGIEVCFKSEPDNGIADAFNKGILRSTGELIGIINSDDELADDILDTVVAAFDDNVSVVCGDCLWVDERNGIQYVRKSRMNLKMLKYEMVLMHPSCFVRRSAYEKWGGFDTGLKCVMDKDLMARFYRNGAEFRYLPQIITRMSAGGVSDTNVDKVRQEGIIVAQRNGVPRWKILLRHQYKKICWKAIVKIKQNKVLWSLIGK